MAYPLVTVLEAVLHDAGQRHRCVAVRAGYLIAVMSIMLFSACGDRAGALRAKATPAPDSSSVGSLPLGPIPADDSLARPKSLQQVGVPAALTRAATPPNNPQTPEKIALGEKLFFDGRLSANGTVACASCHDPRLAFTDGRPVSVGIANRVGQRNSPTVLNVLYNKTQFWDGRVATLKQQAALPIANPVEMGNQTLDSAVAHIAAVLEYRYAFRRVFGRQPNGLDLVRAIASYERSQISFDSPFDHFYGRGSQRDRRVSPAWLGSLQRARRLQQMPCINRHDESAHDLHRQHLS